MKKYAYYPGCSLSGTGLELGISTKAIAGLLNIELVEVPDWNCCGASSAHAVDRNLALALPARNAAIAEEMGMGLAIPCPACYTRCKHTEVEVKKSQKTKEKVEYILGRPYEGKYPARTLLEIIANDIGAGVGSNAKLSLKGIKAACYYGCLLTRPEELTGFDATEDPQMMDTIIKRLGGDTVSWNGKVKCCGGSLPTADPKLGMDMTQEILDDAKKSGANCIVTACPLCMTNVDMRQKALGNKQGAAYDLPVFYFTELIGLACGMPPKQVGLDHHFIDPTPVYNLLGAEERAAMAAATDLRPKEGGDAE